MSDNESESSNTKEPKTRKIKQLSQLEFMKQSCAWIGSKTLQELELYILNKESNKFQLDTIKITPGLTKIVDEGITNAIDHYVNYPKLVKNIKITFDTKSGAISIYNDGPGISVELNKNLAGKEMYTPQMIASEFHTGDNFNEDERTTGGANGIGLKALAAYSDYLILETLDDVNKIHYTQTFKNRLELIEEPVLEKTKAGAKGFTKITFLPCYTAFGIPKYGPKKDGTNISKWIETRAYQAAACTTAAVYYNDELVDICNEPKNVDKIPRGFVKNTRFRQLVELFLEDNEEFESIILKPSEDSLIKYPLEVHIAASDKKFRQHSLINGVCAYDGGNHIKHLQNQLIEGLKPHVEKIIKKTKSKFNSNLILNNIFLFVKATIPNPSWGGGNIKSKLDNDVASFAGYTFSKSDITKIWNLLENTITSQFIDKVSDKKKTKVNRSQIIIKKSDDAQFAGHKTKWSDCTLFIAEGDSALATVKEGILSKETDLTKEYYGTFNILGVPINCRKEANTIKDPKTGEYKVIRNDKLQKNERLTALVKMLGLDYEKKYGTDAEGNAEFTTLRYGRVCICTDADVDGCGQICGLLLNFFILFWPGLIKRGYVCRLNTPIIRAYPRNTKQYIKEFYTDKTYRAWIQDEFKGDDANADKMYDIRYYKGLGSHEKNEIPQLFKKFEEKLYIYQLDKKALDTVEIYFGKETSARKKVLSTPVSIEEPDGPKVPLSDFLNIDVKLFQRDNIARKIPHAYDGQVPSRRKVIYAARAEFANKNERMKVNAFTNITSKMTSYHHGEQSLSTTITKMSQEFIGAKNLPFLRPRGQFGCLAPDTPILLWNSSIKKAKDIKIGDILIGDNGEQRIVSELTSGIDDMYKITNGHMQPYTVNSNHILTLYYPRHKKIYWKDSDKKWIMQYFDQINRTINSITIGTNIQNNSNHANKSKLTKELAYDKIKQIADFIPDIPNNLIDITIQDYLKLSKSNQQKCYGILNTSIIQWEEQPIEIDPYILGMWLGDGMSDCSAFSSADAILVKEWAIWLDKIGCEVMHAKNVPPKESYAYRIRRRGSGPSDKYPIGHKNHNSKTCIGCLTSAKKSEACDWTFDKNNTEFIHKGFNKSGIKRIDLNPFKELMKKYNLANNKHVPIQYILNSEENRLKILAGMIDTDGTLKKDKNSTHYSITQSPKRAHILESFRIIAGSLGFRAKISKHDDMLYLTIFGDDLYKIPTKLPRKQLNSSISHRINVMAHSITIEPVGKGEFYGWTIDQNERFLLGDFTITHNTRAAGGKDYASPRYIYTNLNKRLCMAMFPSVDDYLLPYVFDEGNRCEPVYYLPILPLAILENMELPATGWKVKIWAREIWSVIDQVEKLIKGEQKKCKPLPIWNTSPGSEIRKYKSKQYSFGKYIYDAKTHNLTVTALPLGVFSCQIAGTDDDNGGMRDEFRAKPCDETSDTEVKITFYFKPDSIKDIKKAYGNGDIDCFEDYLNLKNSLDENINMIDGEGKIIEYKTYNDVVDDWFKARSSLYAERIDREIILTNLRILYLKNVIKFIKNHLKYEINPKKKRIDVDKILAKAEYDTFNKALLFSPKYTKAAELRHLIINNIAAGTSYDYLVNLRYSDLLEEACLAKEEELKKEMEKLKDLEDDIGDENNHLKGGKTWMRELNELKEVIKLGLEKGWDYGKKVAKFKD